MLAINIHQPRASTPLPATPTTCTEVGVEPHPGYVAVWVAPHADAWPHFEATLDLPSARLLASRLAAAIAAAEGA